MKDIILIVDFGSQYTQLIARRVRELGVYCEIHPYTVVNVAFIKKYDPKAIILSGGPAFVGEENAPTLPKEILDQSIPVLGICYGQQWLAAILGGDVSSSDKREFGRAILKIRSHSLLCENIGEVGAESDVWMSHCDQITRLPEGFSVIANSDGAPYAIIEDRKRKLYGVQFHPEVTHTHKGDVYLRNFIFTIAHCTNSWTMHNFLEETITSIRTQVGTRSVLCGVSGGVDSSVVACLLHKAIGKQLTCVFVDNGLLRKNEGQEVKALFNDTLKIPLHYVDASRVFLDNLQGISDPEKKRKIIGKTFIDIFEAESEALDLKEDAFLAQGTLYPDVIESLSVHGGSAVTIKSHHNVGGLPERMKMQLIEPVRMLFKDEVRHLGSLLSLSEEAMHRHPFPGPGLGVRILGEVTEAKVKLLQEADALYIDAIKKAGLYRAIWQAFAVLLPIQTVGVMGDSRTYESVLALRAVTSQDGMTASSYPFTHEFLVHASEVIINNVKGISRVVYDVTSKPPSTIEWE